MMIATALLIGQTLCPPWASTISVWASVQVYPNYVTAGESVWVQVALTYLPSDPITLGTNGTFGGGTATVYAGGRSFNLTPPGGIPQIGPCGIPQWFTNITYLALQGGPVVFSYVGDAGPYQARASSVTAINVNPHGKIHIEAHDSLPQVWWYGQSGSYELQGSTNAMEWTAIATFSRDTPGQYHYQDSTTNNMRFYRYRRL